MSRILLLCIIVLFIVLLLLFQGCNIPTIYWLSLQAYLQGYTMAGLTTIYSINRESLIMNLKKLMLSGYTSHVVLRLPLVYSYFTTSFLILQSTLILEILPYLFLEFQELLDCCQEHSGFQPTAVIYLENSLNNTINLNEEHQLNKWFWNGSRSSLDTSKAKYDCCLNTLARQSQIAVHYAFLNAREAMRTKITVKTLIIISSQPTLIVFPFIDGLRVAITGSDRLRFSKTILRKISTA